MAKTNSIQIKLVSSAGTGYYYVTKKNPRTSTEKLEFRKFDPVARKHVIFKEAKIKEPPAMAGISTAAPGAAVFGCGSGAERFLVKWKRPSRWQPVAPDHAPPPHPRPRRPGSGRHLWPRRARRRRA